MLKVVVREKEWLQGEYDSMLLRQDGKMCCLGFVCETVGVAREDLEAVPSPAKLMIPELPAGLERLVEEKDPDLVDNEPRRIDLPITEDLMSVNDTLSMEGHKRFYPAGTAAPKTYPTGWPEDLIGKPIDPDEQKFYAMKKARIKELGLQAGIDFEFVAE